MIVHVKKVDNFWCPFVRAGENRADAARNRDDKGLAVAGAQCFGPGCMAWRWSDPDENETGFCGLAGKPVEAAPKPAR